MNTPQQPLTRRTFLRGVGVTMALPWLESVPVWGDDKPKNSSSEPHRRFGRRVLGLVVAPHRHRLQPRQRHRHADAAKEGAARQGLLRSVHALGILLVVWCSLAKPRAA